MFALLIDLRLSLRLYVSYQVLRFGQVSSCVQDSPRSRKPGPGLDPGRTTAKLRGRNTLMTKEKDSEGTKREVGPMSGERV